MTEEKPQAGAPELEESVEALEEGAIPDPDPPREDEPLPEAPLRAILEALLFAGEEPLTPADVAEVLGEQRRPEIDQALRELQQDYDRPGKGLRVQAVAGGLRITTDPALGPFVRALVRSRNRHRLSRAALETLAIVAYKQPITAPEIQEIRGVSPSAILATLLERRLVRILGRKKVVGKPFVYGTTREFLIRFGLNSLSDLPSMEEFEAMLEADAGDGQAAAPSSQEPPPSPGEEPAESNGSGRIET
ncbi:MAG TPA: SMC-Scp complex subunit ScpB [Candidatus Polarisedimenticolia bacterium]|nr:SMC-Scp complex subunit ScpB [Candidatus Polarisedimenticolia bacterium]